MKVRSRVLAKARRYVDLEPETEYPDTAAAIAMARELVRLNELLERA